MLVLAAVPDLPFQKLRGAVAPRFSVAHASTWDSALETIRSRPVEIAVVDPALGGAAGGQEIERVHLRFPSLRLLLDTAMAPQLAPVLLTVGPFGVCQVVIVGLEVDPGVLSSLVASNPVAADSCRSLNQVTAALATLPLVLQWILKESLRAPSVVHTTEQVPAHARVVRGTCGR